jgi:predicted O-methyltransferase YrrM
MRRLGGKRRPQNGQSFRDLVSLASAVETSPDDRPIKLLRLQEESYPQGVSLYYRFFKELSVKLKPSVVLEVGTYLGASAAHLAFNSSTQVVTLDIDREAAKRVDRLGLKNVKALTLSSLQYIEQLGQLVPNGLAIFDLVFLDGSHLADDVYREYQCIRPFVRTNGLIFIDDIVSTEEMRKLWGWIREPKLELNSLHWSGFGVVRVDRKPAPIRRSHSHSKSEH